MCSEIWGEYVISSTNYLRGELIISSKPYQKITIREYDTTDTIKRIIKSKKPKVLILESGTACGPHTQLIMNQKTYWISQNLASDGWKIEKVKHYKGKLLKVIFSSK